MAKRSSVQKNNRRKRLTAKYAGKREQLKTVIYNKELPIEERFDAQLKLSQMPRNGAATRVRNRCALTGRPRGYYRKFALSRIILRDLAAIGQIPGMTKSSW